MEKSKNKKSSIWKILSLFLLSFVALIASYILRENAGVIDNTTITLGSGLGWISVAFYLWGHSRITRWGIKMKWISEVLSILSAGIGLIISSGSIYTKLWYGELTPVPPWLEMFTGTRVMGIRIEEIPSLVLPGIVIFLIFYSISLIYRLKLRKSYRERPSLLTKESLPNEIPKRLVTQDSSEVPLEEESQVSTTAGQK